MKRIRNVARVVIIVVAVSCFAGTAAARPQVTKVVNAASYQTLIAPGSLISIFGDELALSTAVASQTPLPRLLDGVTVSVGGIDAPLYFVSPRQINAQIPFEISGDSAPFVVVTPGGRSSEYTLTLVAAAPGIFTTTADGNGKPLLFDANFALIDTATPGDRVILYATGLGATDPPAISGHGGAEGEPLSRAAMIPQVYVGEQEATVEYAGLAPGFCGVYQLNVVIPEHLAGGRVFLLSGGVQSNVTTIEPGRTRHVVGSGIRVSEVRTVSNFHHVRLLAMAEVEITVGQGASLRIEADENVLELIDTRVKDGVLLITTRGTYTIRHGVKIFATVPSLEGIEVLAMGMVRANRVWGDALEVNVSGMGHVSASGSVRSVRVRVQGVGQVHLFDLAARSAHVMVEGMGNVEVNAADSLFARVHGFGNVVYSGNPGRVDAKVDGFGTIRPRDGGWQWWNPWLSW